MACLPHWCCSTVLPDGVTHNTILYINDVTLHAYVHGHRENLFQGGPLVDFSKSFF